ncbi:hypothetical protein LH685_17010 [Acinetobacter nosocomialis]|uniref:hypothetical protein n=1 Tax=Acinetobacter nosocomialis TaxID=106654 RepID=UPI001F42D32C|nr:hypothetical protein [Acinetobacter nosocomialis]MCF1294609.1 hypothetical protein [Acinetobacter nosocomialis]MCF1297468.1 hypothetical protein [Acinetobacter nosocomialis]
MNYTWDEFEQRLITYRDVRIDLARVLDAYELQIKELLQKIQLLAYEESLPIFNQLYEIQDHLAIGILLMLKMHTLKKFFIYK